MARQFAANDELRFDFASQISAISLPIDALLRHHRFERFFALAGTRKHFFELSIDFSISDVDVVFLRLPSDELRLDEFFDDFFEFFGTLGRVVDIVEIFALDEVAHDAIVSDVVERDDIVAGNGGDALDRFGICFVLPHGEPLQAYEAEKREYMSGIYHVYPMKSERQVQHQPHSTDHHI